MKTQIKKWGNSLVIVLNQDFINFHTLSEGDWVDLDDLVKIYNKPKRRKLELGTKL